MKKLSTGVAFGLALALAAATFAHADVAGPNFGYIGNITPRSTAEIVAAGHTSPFGIGGETTDRSFSTFSTWKNYLGPLGASKIRIQSGWHYIEPVIYPTPVYNFAKLDEIVDGVRAQGVKPFMFLGYGNERAGCANCGTQGLGGTLPTGAGLDKYLAFVRATVTRYNSPTVRVNDWQIWNEPDGHVPALDYATLAVATAKAIKQIQPNAKITIGSFTTGVLGGTASDGYAYASTVLDHFENNKGATVADGDVTVGYHPYWGLPDYDSYPSENTKFTAFKSLVESKGYKIRQDENGAPSTQCLYFALCGTTAWDEENQAKYILRRMLGDFYRQIETSIFTIVDLHYDSTKNTKGLLRTGTWDASNDTPYTNGDQSVKGKKLAYSSYQNVTGVFDNRLVTLPTPSCTAPYGYTVHAYTRNDAGVVRNMLAVWRKTTELPAPANIVNIDITCTNFHFPRFASSATLRPRYADLLDGRVYQLSTATTIVGNSAANNDVSLKGIPVGDHPVLIADQGLVPYTP
ncbi:MAG: hypothetical protein JWR60_2859 [Polaromonas sp.]|nr:hypothetical protein [Polaromonas sp.]